MLSKQEEKFIASASHYATLSPMNNHHGCIVVLNGQEIGAGYNNYRNYSRDKIISDCLSCHAEISAVRNAIKIERNARRIKKMKVYVVRVNDQGKYLDSKPCYNCHCQMHSLGIRNVIYSTGEDFVCMDLRRHRSGNVSTGYRFFRNL
jgi:tRNA(Arg) A34 adenosine deaminase TadA